MVMTAVEKELRKQEDNWKEDIWSKVELREEDKSSKEGETEKNPPFEETQSSKVKEFEKVSKKKEGERNLTHETLTFLAEESIRHYMKIID